MDDAELIAELLEETLSCQQPDATPEHRARLERLLADHPRAIAWYLAIVDDTLTLIDSVASSGEERGVRSAEEEEDGEERGASCLTTRSWLLPCRASAGGLRRWLAITAAIACSLFVLVAGYRVWQGYDPNWANQLVADVVESGRIVEISKVVWAEGAQRRYEWELVNPGDVLKFESGRIDLFLSGGAELLIEGPADVEYISAQRVFARKGKLAARVGPGAIGFRIDTPRAKVIDRGTVFGVSVDGASNTSVVVYEGMVDLDVIGNRTLPQRRLNSGEAVSVDEKGQLRRITTVESADFLEPPQSQHSGLPEGRIITSVTDNVRSLETAKYYRIIPHGFKEDCRAYVDRLHEWNGVDVRKLPPFLLDGDYVMTFNEDKFTTQIQIAVGIGQPANVYVLIDDRVPPPDWLKREFVDTNWDVGCDEGWEDKIIDTGLGAGNSIDHVFSVWQRVVPEPTTAILGPLIDAKSPLLKADDFRSMYGIVVTPLSRGAAGVPGR